MSTISEETIEKDKTAFVIIKNWFINSPTHGFRRISRAKSIPGQLFWSIIFVIFTTFMSIFIYTIITNFIAHPTKINLTVRQDRHFERIPTITFCKQIIFSTTTTKKTKTSFSLGNLNPLSYQTFQNETLGRQSNPCSDGGDGDRNRFIAYMCGILTDSLSTNHLSVFRAGYQLNELLIQCKFNQYDCHENFTTFFHPNYGNCYTFDYGNDIEKYVSKPASSQAWTFEDENLGGNPKLFLELYSCQEESIHEIEDRAGFRIFIHRKNEIPILAENSLLLPPKTFTQLIYSQRIIKFSRQCRVSLTDDMKQMFNSNSVRYSQALCLKLCEFRFIQNECNCTDQLFLVFARFFSRNRTKTNGLKPPCSIQNHCPARIRFSKFHFSHEENKKKLSEFIIESKEFCPECLPECELIQYTIQSSYADYPNSLSTDLISGRIEKHLKSTANRPDRIPSACLNSRKIISRLDGIIAVEISASPYATEVLVESPMYTWVDLISSIGGQTGSN